LPIIIRNNNKQSAPPPPKAKPNAGGISKLTAALGRAANSANAPQPPVAAQSTMRYSPPPPAHVKGSLQDNMGALQRGGRSQKVDENDEADMKRRLDAMTGVPTEVDKDKDA
jgi:hypothetical protein